MKTASSKDQKYVWRWYYVDKDGNWVGPYRNRKDVAECARSSMRGGDDVVEIAMWKTSTLDLSEPIDDAFAEEMLLSLMMDADVYGKYETRFEIEIEISPEKAAKIASIVINGIPLSEKEIGDFARADGFKNGPLGWTAVHAMGSFFKRHHGFGTFHGVVIHWRLSEPLEAPE